ncbi:hypothetical protein QF035_009104 [Streptomyces umbrinus]|uniref:Uncharacterized protein n=1 Tax=Streptomyces umbrinus TaxID=67370 RepID=A0ABU0T7J1_9ACTN|nr:hypothetical protein [Streptomyces umbrinus]MDQ1031522.1 hypothetical protein [Streptomyces umbrinus]
MDVSLRTQPHYLEGLWSGLYVTPTFHDNTEREWRKDQLVPVAGAFFPPRFRLNLASRYGSDIDVCAAFRVENGTFASPNGMPLLGVPCAADHGRALDDLVGPLTRALVMVPNLITIAADGRWTWKPIGWQPTPPTSPDTVAYRRWAEQVKLQKDIFPWVYAEIQLDGRLRQRMSERWHSYFLPRIEVVARAVAEAQQKGHTVTAGLRQACCLLETGESTARALLALAREIGLLPYGEAPEPVIPWWMYEENTERVLALARTGNLVGRHETRRP